MKTKITAAVLIIVMLCAMCCIMSACPKKDEKYDVTMKVVCREVVNGYLSGPILEEWIFTPDIETLYTEREYDGKQYAYFLYRYNLPDHPSWSEDWFTPKFEGSNSFITKFYKIDGEKDERVMYVCEKGKYQLYTCAYITSDIWKFRGVSLFITVK